MNLHILIPAYKPDRALPVLVHSLLAEGGNHVIVVDDGSGPAYAEVFAALEKLPGCHVLRHAVNMGKGRALKTGFNFFCLTFPQAAGLVTADADGQHTPADILKLCACLEKNSRQVTLGVRLFDGKVPLRSRFGNSMTGLMFKFMVGQKLADTQTGLRAIASSYIPALLTMQGDGYEFEMNMLLCAKQHGVKLAQKPIETVYLEDNRSSHFNPIFDSLRIYFLLARFVFSSLLAALLDFAVFSLGYKFITANILANMAAGRVVSCTVNFMTNKGFVFRDSNRFVPEISKYLLLAATLMALSYVSILILMEHFSINPVTAKVLIETLLFFASFTIQRDYIFTKGLDEA